MSQLPTVSVLIPIYNAEKTIRRTLLSVRAQTLQPDEIIVVDDGSTDNTASVVEEFSCELNSDILKYVKLNSNKGVYFARNVGWDMANGELLALLDADDSWHPQKLEIQVNYMARHKELVLTGHHAICISEDSPPPAIPQNWEVTPITKRQIMFFSCLLWMPSIILRREIPYRFDSSMRCLGDRQLLMEMILDGCKTARLNLPLVCLYKAPYGESGISRRLWESEKAELQILSDLRKKGLLGRPLEVLFKGWSLIKYVRRLYISWRR